MKSLSASFKICSRATKLTLAISAPASSWLAGAHSRCGNPATFFTTSFNGTSSIRTSNIPGPSLRSTPRAVQAFPWGSRSITKTLRPPIASAAATLTAVVVLPTPPFWLATVKIRVLMGLGIGSLRRRIPTTFAAGLVPGPLVGPVVELDN